MTDSPGWRPAPGSATGVGSLPGTDAREAVATVVGELPQLPHLPELPGRGPGADLVGRTAALLVDLHVDMQPSGWRLVDRPGMDERRARAYLGEDLDELEAATQSWVGPLKVQACGPWTAAAALHLPRGEPVLSDPGALRDLVASLTEGLLLHLADVRRRVPGAELVLQLDEPSLPAVLAGGVRSSSGARAFAPVKETTAEDLLRSLVATLDLPVLVHCCAARPPVDLLRRAGAAGVSVDLTLLGPEVDDELGEVVDAGLLLLAGLVPAVPTASAPLSAVAPTVEPVRRLWQRLGLTQAQLAEQVVVTPTCGLAGASPAHARAAMVRAREAASALTEMEV